MWRSAPRSTSPSRARSNPPASSKERWPRTPSVPSPAIALPPSPTSTPVAVMTTGASMRPPGRSRMVSSPGRHFSQDRSRTRKSRASTAATPARRNGERGPSTFTRASSFIITCAPSSPRRETSSANSTCFVSASATTAGTPARRSVARAVMVPPPAKGTSTDDTSRSVPRRRKAARESPTAYGPTRAPENRTWPAASSASSGPDTWTFRLALPADRVRTRARDRRAGSGASASTSSPSRGLQRLLTVPCAEIFNPSPSTRKSRTASRERSNAKSASR